jgi:hypothetical protein
MIDDKEIEEAFQKWTYPSPSISAYKAFKAGAHFGYAKAIEQASEKDNELFNKLIAEWTEKHKQLFTESDDEFLGHTAMHFFKKAYSAAKLSSAKEIERYKSDYKKDMAMKDKEIAYLKAECERLYEPTKKFWNEELEAKLAVAIEALEKYANNEFITWLVATQQGMDCDPTKRARDTLTRLKSNGPITSEE